MAPRPLCLTFCQLLGWLVLLARRSATNHAELLGLRHQVAVLHRQVARPRLDWADRAVLAGRARLLPHPAWHGLFVQPATLLRWHPDLVRRRWTHHTGVAVQAWRRRSGIWCCGWPGRTRPAVGRLLAAVPRAQATGVLAVDCFTVDTVCRNRGTCCSWSRSPPARSTCSG